MEKKLAKSFTIHDPQTNEVLLLQIATSGYFFVKKNGEIIFWTTKKGEKFYLFKRYLCGGNGVVKIEHISGWSSLFSKKTRKEIVI